MCACVWVCVPSKSLAPWVGLSLLGFPPATLSGAVSPWPNDWSIPAATLRLLLPAGHWHADAHPVKHPHQLDYNYWITDWFMCYRSVHTCLYKSRNHVCMHASEYQKLATQSIAHPHFFLWLSWFQPDAHAHTDFWLLYSCLSVHRQTLHRCVCVCMCVYDMSSASWWVRVQRSIEQAHMAAETAGVATTLPKRLSHK